VGEEDPVLGDRKLMVAEVLVSKEISQNHAA
jgi:hypothetical protein